MFKHDIAIHFGSRQSAVLSGKKGIIIREPSIVAVDHSGDYFCGSEAQNLTKGNIEHCKVIYPIEGGKISNYKAARYFMQHLVQKSTKILHGYKNLQALVCVHPELSQVEEMLITKLCLQSGIKKVMLVKEPICCAEGAGLNPVEPFGKMVVNIDSTYSSVSVLSCGDIVLNRSLDFGAEEISSLIIGHFKDQSILVSKASAIKALELFNKGKNEFETFGHVAKDDQIVQLKLNIDEIDSITEPIIKTIENSIKEILDQCPIELFTDMINSGIMMTGQGAYLWIAKILQQKLNLRMSVAQDPADCAVVGMGMMINYNKKIHVKPALLRA